MPTNVPKLKKILAKLKGENSITVLKEYYQGEWEFYDLLRDLMNDKIFNNRAKTFYMLTGNIDDSGDDDSCSCDSPLSFVSNSVQANGAYTSQSQCG